jgi:TldD protein
MLDTTIVDRLIATALERGGDYADVFCERRLATSFRLQSGHIHESGLTVTQGVGIRVIIGESAGYAYSDDLSTEALQRAAHIASLIARDGGAGQRTVRVRNAEVARFYDANRTAHAPSEAYVKLL